MPRVTNIIFPDCEELLLHAGNGRLYSVGYPDEYPNYVDCTYNIVAEEGMVGNTYHFFNMYPVGI